MPVPFEHLAHAARINVVVSRYPVLKLAVPMANPDVHGIMERQAIARR
jgi:hypothetical protein